MLYFLLIIIAVGVLLISEGGQSILGFLIILGLIVGALYLGFWIIIIAFGLLTTGGLFADGGSQFWATLIIGACILVGWLLLNRVGKKKK